MSGSRDVQGPFEDPDLEKIQEVSRCMAKQSARRVDRIQPRTLVDQETLDWSLNPLGLPHLAYKIKGTARISPTSQLGCLSRGQGCVCISMGPPAPSESSR